MRIFKNNFFGTSMIFIIIELLFVIISGLYDISPKIIAICFTAILGVYGYFITHYLEIKRKEREKKLELYLRIAKSLRFFLREPLNTKDDDKKLIDIFQDSYFESALFVSKKVHEQLVKFIKTSQENFNDPNEESKRKCDNELSVLINTLRNEFFSNEQINFEFFKIEYKK